jgi:hypothetical protein
MAGVVPVVHALLAEASQERRDARDKRGHGGEEADSISTERALSTSGDGRRRDDNQSRGGPFLIERRRVTVRVPFGRRS